jgi:hypothetical protein
MLNASQKALLEWIVERGSIVVFADSGHGGDDHDMVICGKENHVASRRDLEVLVRQRLLKEVAADNFDLTEHGRDFGGQWRR